MSLSFTWSGARVSTRNVHPGNKWHTSNAFEISTSINQSIKTHFYSAICREQIRGAWGTPHSGDLIVPRVNLSKYGQRSFAYVAPHIWNSLPQQLKESFAKRVQKKTKDTFLSTSNL